MSGSNQPEIVEPEQPGHIIEEPEGSGESTPRSKNDDVEADIDEKLAQATRQRDALIKKRQLENINAEIDALRHGATHGRRSEDSDGTHGSRIRRRSETHDSDLGAGTKRYPEVDLTRPAKRRSVKPKDLSDYHGKSRREHRDWVRDANVAFENAPDYFPDDYGKIVWAMQFLQGDPKEQWHNEREKEPEKARSWSYFETFLLDKVQDPINRQLDVNQSYTDARQRTSQTASQFEAYFSSLEAQLPPSDEPQRVAALMTRLLPELQDAIVRAGEVPKTRNGVISAATRIENTEKRANARSTRGKSGQNTQGSGGNRGKNKSNKPSEGDRAAQSRRDRETNASRRSNAGEPRGKAPKSKEYLKQVECYNCHKKGHYSNECTAPKSNDANRVPVGGVGNLGAHAVEPSTEHAKSGKGKPSSKTP